MIPQFDRVAPAIAKFFRIGGYTADVGTGISPVVVGTDLTDSAAPPFAPFVGGFNCAALAAAFSYHYIGLDPSVAPASSRLHIRRLIVQQADGTLKFGLEKMGTGILRTFASNTNPVHDLNGDATGQELGVSLASTFPVQRLPIYHIVGNDATDLWTGAAQNRVMTGQTGLNVIDVQIILRPGIFFFLQTNLVNQALFATVYGRFYD